MALVPKQCFTNPEEFEAQMAIAVPGLQIRPTRGKRFQVDLSLAPLPRMALFSVESVNLSAQQGETCGVTIPVSGGFSAAVGGLARHHSFDADEIYLKPQDRDFDYRAPGSSQVLVANLLSPDLQQKADALTGASSVMLAEVVSVASPSGGALTRFAHHFWAELQRPGGLWDSPVALAEMEDCLVSLLALAGSTPDPGAGSAPRTAMLHRAEDYLVRHLASPVTRSELAAAAGVSISTVTRGFRERHGVGPIAWLKARRLEAVRAELCNATPDATTVTAVALRYGFDNLGRFAAEYRQRFGEIPSQTLRR